MLMLSTGDIGGKVHLDSRVRSVPDADNCPIPAGAAVFSLDRLITCPRNLKDTGTRLGLYNPRLPDYHRVRVLSASECVGVGSERLRVHAPSRPLTSG